MNKEVLNELMPKWREVAINYLSELTPRELQKFIWTYRRNKYRLSNLDKKAQREFTLMYCDMLRLGEIETLQIDVQYKLLKQKFSYVKKK
ncbi:MAG: hypothetical protein IJ759_07915 [Bacteroidales bacterium]|nr:hypothetical protein [Bacteroidales bacterium]MBR1775430.1 hypothetical protein [Bacteroidales bacterium]